MKWFGEGKQTFMEWFDKASEQELRSYVLEKKFLPLWQKALMVFLVLLLVSGVYAWILVPVGLWSSTKLLNTKNEVIQELGEYVCYEHGGFMKWSYKPSSKELFLSCVDKNIKVN